MIGPALLVPSGALRALVVVKVLEVGVDDVIVARTALICGTGFTIAFFGLGLVDRLAKFHGGLGDVLDARLDLFGGHVVLLEVVLEGGDGQFDRLHRGRIDLVGVLFQRLLGRMNQAFGLVLGFDQLAARLVGLGVFFGFLDHLLDVFVAEAARRLDRDLLFLVGALVLGGNRDDAVGVDVECHLDLGYAARCGRNVFEVELTEHLVVGRHFTFALEDTDRHGALVVLGGREDLRLVGGDRGVAVDQAGEDTAERFDTERQRRYVEQDHILDVTLKHAGLNGGTHGDDFVGVDALVGFLAEELGHFLDDLGHTGHAADENDLVDFAGGDAGILESRGAGLHRGLDEIAHQAFELGTGQFHDHVQRLPVRAHRDEGLVDFRLRTAGQFDLGFLGGFLEALQSHLVLGQIDAMLFLELVGEVADDPHVEVFTTQEGVTIGGFHLEQAIVDFKHGDVEGAAAKVIDGDGLRFFLVETIGQRGGCRLVDDAQHFETGDLAGVFGGLTLSVIEIGGNGDDGLRHLFAEIGFGGFLHLAEDEGGNLRGAVFLAARLNPCVAIAAIDDGERHVLLVLGQIDVVHTATDQALDAEDGVFRVGHGLTLGRLADETFVFGEGHDRWRRTGAFGVFDDAGLTAIHDGDAAVGGSEVDTDHFGHVLYPFFNKAMFRTPDPITAPGPRS